MTDSNGASTALSGDAAQACSCSTIITAPLTTVHLPAERAVLTTPGMLGLIERCIARAESDSGESGWLSRSAEIKHRAGLRPGETLTVTVGVDYRSDRETAWLVRATADDTRLIGEGSVVRVRSE